MVAAAGVFGGILIGDDGTSSLVFIAGAILFATLLGTANATAFAYGRVVPFIATLAMFSIGRGIALLLNDKLPVSLLDLNERLVRRSAFRCSGRHRPHPRHAPRSTSSC